jgi:hypothetical protein
VLRPLPPRRPAPTCARRWRPASRSTTRSSTGSTSRLVERRSRNGGPSWTPPFAARDRRPGRVRARGDRHRYPAGDGRAAYLSRPSVRREFRAPDPVRRGPAGQDCAAGTAAVGRRRKRPADGPGPVRRLGTKEKPLHANMAGTAHPATTATTRRGGRAPAEALSEMDLSLRSQPGLRDPELDVADASWPWVIGRCGSSAGAGHRQVRHAGTGDISEWATIRTAGSAQVPTHWQVPRSGGSWPVRG